MIYVVYLSLLFRKKNRRNKQPKPDENGSGENHSVVPTENNSSVTPSSAFERDQLVKIKKAMEMLQLQVKSINYYYELNQRCAVVEGLVSRAIRCLANISDCRRI
jgi:hypothetical protein